MENTNWNTTECSKCGKTYKSGTRHECSADDLELAALALEDCGLEEEANDKWFECLAQCEKENPIPAGW